VVGPMPSRRLADACRVGEKRDRPERERDHTHGPKCRGGRESGVGDGMVLRTREGSREKGRKEKKGSAHPALRGLLSLGLGVFSIRFGGVFY
jgi:hypothetical protein